jgi:predicted RNA-binding Zn-ribbon protein involved in translation (DUF1610 family)
MAVAQGTCPSCGAPIEFGVGSSIAKVCPYCNATILRTDRGLQNLGKVADLAMTPSLIAVGDQGTLSGRPFEVLGRVQLDHGAGPWDEYYVAFDYGQAWGWLAYAQGHWYVTTPAPALPVAAYNALSLELDVPLGQYGTFRVAEIKSGTIRSAEGELPAPFRPGFVRYYADLYGPNNAFATLDYGENTGGYTVFTGWIFAEPQMQVTQIGPRTAQKVKTQQIKCPSCGGDIPKLSGDRAERVGCPYCGAVSDIAAQQVIAQQERSMQMPEIPIGSRGVLEGVEYVCIAYMRRGTDFDGEHFTWEEYLLWSQAVGFRWLVKDPESGWTWVVPVNLSEIDLRGLPQMVSWGGRIFQLRNQNSARVEYVLGEVYWKCEVGETTRVMDFTNGRDVLSREEGAGEARWSYSTPVPWAALAQAFSLPVDGAGGQFAGASAGGSGVAARGGCASAGTLLVIIAVVLLICMLGACGSCMDGEDDGTGTSTRGGGVFYGGK